MAEAAGTTQRQPEPEPMEAALPSRLSVTVPTAAAQAAPTMTSPKGSWRLATEKVKTVNSVSEVMKESYERKRPRGMSTMSTAESDQKNRKQKMACCSSRPTETDSLMVPSRGTENFRDRLRPAKSQSNGELLELAMQAGLTDVEGQVVMELFLLATDNEEWLNADSLKEMMRWFTLQLDEHQLKNILKDIHVKYAAETMEQLDSSRDDLVNFRQFVWLINGYKTTAFTDAAFREAFKVLDPDGDGELTREEIQRGLEIVGHEVTDDDADEMLNYADRCASLISGEDIEMSGDGKVMQHEFVSFMGHPEYINLGRLGNDGQDSGDARSIELWNTVRALMLGIHSMHELWEKALLLYDEEYMEQWDAEKQNRHCFYNPSSPGRQAWDFIMLPFFFVIAIVVPYRIGFDIDVPFGSFGFWLDALIDLYFAVDIVVNFRTAYYDDSGKLVTDLKMIAKKYARTWFIIDFVSCVPIGYIFMIIDSTDGGTDSGNANKIKLTKVLRLVRLAKNLARIARLKKLKTLMEEYEDYFEPIMTGLHLFKLFCALLFLGHVMACFWYYVGVDDHTLPDGQNITGWVSKEGWGPEVGYSTRYLASYFYSLTDFVGELGQTNAERLYGLCSHLLYETFFGFLVGTFATIVMSGRVSDQKKAEKLQGVREFTHQQKLPMKGRKKIRSFYEILYKHNTVFDEGELLEDLPESVRRSLTSTIHKNFTATVTFFRGFQEEVTVPLFLALKHVRLDVDEIVVKEGELSREIYVVLDGSAEVYVKWTLPDRTRVGTVSKGAIFGEIELLAHIDNPELIPIRRRTVKVAHLMNAGFIRYDRLQEIMKQHPSVLDRIRSFSKKRQRSEREKLAETRSAILGAEKTDSKSLKTQSLPEIETSPRSDLTKGLHQGMSDWDWRRRVDARLDVLLTQVLERFPANGQPEVSVEGTQRSTGRYSGGDATTAATGLQTLEANGRRHQAGSTGQQTTSPRMNARASTLKTPRRAVSPQSPPATASPRNPQMAAGISASAARRSRASNSPEITQRVQQVHDL